MRTRKPTSTCSARVPWRQTRRRLVPFIGHADTLHTCRDEDGADWWSDGNAIFRGAAPAYLRQAYRDAGLPVDVPVQRVPLMLAFARSASATRLDLPATCEATSMLYRDIVPVDVFASRGLAPDAHVDARYLAYARDRFAGCTFWHIDEACIAVRDQRDQALVGIIQLRILPNRPKPKSRRGAA